MLLELRWQMQWVHVPTAQLFAQHCCSGVTPLETLERIQRRHLEMVRVQMMTGCKLTLSRKVKGKAKVKTNIKEEIARQTRAPQTSTRARIVGNLDIGRKTAGIPLEERMTIPPAGKGKSKNTEKGKGKHVDDVETEQLQPSETASTVSYPSPDPSVVGELSCISSVDPWIMGVTLNSVSSTRKQAGAEYLFLDTYPGQIIPLPNPGIHTASGVGLQHDGGRLVSYKLPEVRVLFHACAVQKQILFLGRLAEQGYWSDFRADTGTLFFPYKIQTKHRQLH